MLPPRLISCALTRSIRTQLNVGGTRRWLSKPAVSETKLEKLIRDSIKATGPMSLSTYMQLCLSHPTHGYYMNLENPVFGQRGDFITSPEISQVFGELLAIWHLSRWHAAGKPPRIRFVELGPGRGTLAADILRTWSQFPECKAALKEVHLVETSQAMRTLQKETLERQSFGLPLGETDGIQWRDSIEDVTESSRVDGELFTVLVAHELFDALPVYLIERHKNEWHEIRVTTEPGSAKLTTKDVNDQPPPLRFSRIAEQTTHTNFLGALSPRFKKVPEGHRIEVSPVAFKTARQVAELVNDPRSAGGSALIVDYGGDQSFGSSLRAFRKHKIVDVFSSPGECDLTTNVDFALLKEAIADAATVHGPVTQQHFLFNMNINARIAQLVRNSADPVRGDSILRAARRLVDPIGMGSQYKVLGITGSGARTAERKEEEVVWPFIKEEGNALQTKAQVDKES